MSAFSEVFAWICSLVIEVCGDIGLVHGFARAGRKEPIRSGMGIAVLLPLFLPLCSILWVAEQWHVRCDCRTCLGNFWAFRLTIALFLVFFLCKYLI